jgi:hypothetical protein
MASTGFASYSRSLTEMLPTTCCPSTLARRAVDRLFVAAEYFVQTCHIFRRAMSFAVRPIGVDEARPTGIH